MTPLLALVLAGLPHGLWRTERFDDHDQRLVESFDRKVTVVDLVEATTKDDLLSRLAEALSFPQWFGRNWDALNDSLSDAVHNQAVADLTVFDCAGDGIDPEALTTLIEIVGDVAVEAGACFLVAGSGPESVAPLAQFRDRIESG